MPTDSAKISPQKKEWKRKHVKRRPQKYTAAEVAAALRRTHGVYSAAAQILGCSRRTVTEYARRYKTVADAGKEGQAWQIDLATSKLLENVKAGKEASIFFLLKTKGGYIEKNIVGVVNDDPDELVVL